MRRLKRLKRETKLGRETRAAHRSLYMSSPMQPPMPHCGRPQLPPVGVSQTGKELLLAECAAGTLNRFVIFFVPHDGQAAISLAERMSSSKSASHLSQVYS